MSGEGFPDSQGRKGPQGTTRKEEGIWFAGLKTVVRKDFGVPVPRPPQSEHEGALEHSGLSLREGTSVNDLACALASMIEGVWLNQCLTRRHPSDPSEPIATVLRRSGRLLWLGATEPGR
jgi:hypothetical protein